MGGSAAGATSAGFGAEKLAGFKLRGVPVGGYVAQQGPMKNRNFPYVLLGRFLHLEKTLQSRTHARRDSIQVTEGKLQDRISTLNSAQQKALYKALELLSKQRPVDDLAKVLKPLLAPTTKLRSG